MVKCAGCGMELSEVENLPENKRTPCPQCGSLGRALVRVLTDTVEVSDRHRMKLKGGERTASGKPGREVIQGHDFHRKSAEWKYLYRLIDRMKGWYHEKITDLKTGKTVRECQEPLSNHRGLGSAKHK
jgi:DNA-directed RNA polymerase subunit RPC12/RpoP